MLSLVWLSQILRLLDLRFSIATQIFDVIAITLLALPSYIAPIVPFILLISYFYFNYQLNGTNQNLIINQYLDNKDKIKIICFIKIILLLAYIVNTELISPKLYKLYKLKELEIRNNFKLGLPSANEFHIEKELSIFFDTNKNDQFKNVEAIIYKDNQFIKSETAYIELDKLGFNIIFINGVRTKMNDNEKSKTIFKKFTYNILKDNLEKFIQDKEHYNTFGLLKNKQIDFKNHGHNRIIQYMILISLILLSNKIIFKNHFKNINDYKKIIIFSGLLFLYLLNSYLVYELNKENINIYNYYVINFSALTLFNLAILIKYEDNN